MSYTQANEQGPSWMERLPRIQSRSRSSMSAASLDEKTGASGLPLATPGTFLRRQKEEDNPSRAPSRSGSRRRSRRSKNWENGRGPGGPISQSAIAPLSRREQEQNDWRASDSDTLAMKSDPPSTSDEKDDKSSPDEDGPGEIFEEGRETVYEDEEGNVLAVEESEEQQGSPNRERKEEREGRRLMHKEHADENLGVAPTKDDPDTDPVHEALKEAKTVEEKLERPGKGWRGGINKMTSMTGDAIRRRREEKPPKPEQSKESRGPARAYQYGNTIIVEDEDGEVIKKYDIPAPERKGSYTADPGQSRHRIGQMGKMLGLGAKDGKAEAGAAGPSSGVDAPLGSNDQNDDERLRFTITQGGRRMSKAEFIDQICQMDPKSRVKAVEDSDAPEAIKREARKDAREQAQAQASRGRAISDPKRQRTTVPVVQENSEAENEASVAELTRIASGESREGETRLVDSQGLDVPFHDISSNLRSRQTDQGETAAERRRRVALEQQTAEDSDSEDDGTDRVPPTRRPAAATASSSASPHNRNVSDAGETAAERRRREGAFGISREESDSEEEGEVREAPQPRGIRFADQSDGPSQGGEASSRPRQSALRWGKNVGR